MTSVNATNFRKDMFKYLDQALRYNEPINIATKNGDVVILSAEEYRGILETLHIESIPGMKKKILDAMKEEGTPLRGRTLSQFIDEECSG